jgi:hypothetical protein
MAEEATGNTDAAVETSGDSATQPPTEPATEPGAEAALGDAGKQAIARMKADLAEAKKELSAFRANTGDPRGLERISQERKELEELREFRAKSEGREDEYKASQEAQRVKDEALAAANARILKAEVRAAAAGKLNDPTDALAHIDLTSFEVGEDGDVDSDAIGSAISDLISKKPYLAAQGGRFQGSADGGARNDTKKSPAELAAEAAAKGDIRASMAIKADQLIELQKNS